VNNSRGKSILNSSPNVDLDTSIRSINSNNANYMKTHSNE